MGKSLLVVFLLMTGCAAAANSTLISTSPIRYDVTCRDALESCQKEAANVCPNGYTVAKTADEHGTRYSSTTTAAPTYNGEMVVECKE